MWKVQGNHLRGFEESRLCAEQGKSQLVPRQAGKWLGF